MPVLLAQWRKAYLGNGAVAARKMSLPSPRAFFAFLFTERLFTTISEPGTGYGRPGVPSRRQSAVKSLLAGYNSPKLFRTEANGDVPLDGVAFSRLD